MDVDSAGDDDQAVRSDLAPLGLRQIGRHGGDGSILDSDVADSGAVLSKMSMAGITVFKIAIERWPSETSQRDRPQLIRELLDELKAVAAANDRRHQGARNRAAWCARIPQVHPPTTGLLCWRPRSPGAGSHGSPGSYQVTRGARLPASPAHLCW
jgi:hypothetical protein